MKVICDIYKSPREEEMYLYVKKAEALSRVPEPLLEKFGKPKLAMTLLLEPGKKLARVEVGKVLTRLDSSGYYLQLPPAKDTSMQALHLQNAKINL